MTMAYLIVYGADTGDRLAAYKFTSREAARAASLTPLVPRNPPDAAAGGCAYVVEKPEDVTFGGALLLNVFNGLSGKPPVARFVDRPSGIRRLMCLLETVAQDGPVSQQTEEKKVSDETKTKRGRAPKLNDGDVITIVTEEGKNPKRAGSKIHGLWEKLATGSTVAQAHEIGFTSENLLWDVKAGFLKIEAPAAAEAA